MTDAPQSAELQLKHTPGPWHVRGHNGQWGAVYAGTECINGGFSLADARLIAAAPDLLVALQELVHHPYDSEGRNLAALDRARAAIAKATQP